MYKLVNQHHYNLPEGLFILQHDNNSKIKEEEIASLIQHTIDVGEVDYKITTIMWDLTTEEYYALCRKVTKDE